MSSNIYNITKTRKLIDINEDLVNCEVDFQIRTKNKEPFEMVIVDQDTMDNKDVQFNKISDGYISGTVQNPDHKNYFLLLKAENPVDCEVILNRKELPPSQMPQAQHMPRAQMSPSQMSPSQMSPSQMQRAPLMPSQHMLPAQKTQDDSSDYSMIKIILALAVIGGIAYALFIFSKKKTSETPAEKTEAEAVPVFTPVVESAIEMDNPLLRRLKNLRM